MNRKFSSGMRTIVSSQNGCTEKICIRMTHLDLPAANSRGAAGPRCRPPRTVGIDTVPSESAAFLRVPSSMPRHGIRHIDRCDPTHGKT